MAIIKQQGHSGEFVGENSGGLRDSAYLRQTPSRCVLGLGVWAFIDQPWALPVSYLGFLDDGEGDRIRAVRRIQLFLPFDGTANHSPFSRFWRINMVRKLRAQRSNHHTAIRSVVHPRRKRRGFFYRVLDTFRNPRRARSAGYAYSSPLQPWKQ